MDFEIVSNENLAALSTECLVVGINTNAQLTPAAEQLDKASGAYISDLLADGDMTGKPGQTLLLHKVPNLAARRVLLVGLGEEAKRTDISNRKLVTSIMSQAKAISATDLTIALDITEDADAYRHTRHLFEWAGAELYVYDETKSKKADPLALTRIAIALKEDDCDVGEFATQDAAALVNGIATARDLGNLPGNICTPTYLAEQAIALGEECDLLDVQILEEAEMAELGMNSLLSVGKGSEQPSKLIVMNYQGADESQPTHVLVGKGITFDTGGISLKPGASMDEMKFDMCGAASVIGTMTALTELGLDINVVGIVAAAENMPSGNASKPGDIVTTMSGQTVEILNTDAEGRLVLCDALTYAERFNPETVIDVATLTGACLVALGQVCSGLLTNDEALASEITNAGKQSADKVWRLPLWDEYQELLDSNFADMANIGGRFGGTITAACFLSRYTEKYRWAHLDIAGVAWHSAGKAKGATGRVVPLLSQYLMNLAEEEPESEEV
ncbi:MAG: leucyl aminopeptidase [Pontibacterium sp.]